LILSGLDLLATVVISVPICLLLVLVGGLVVRRASRYRSLSLNATVALVVLIGCVVTVSWAYRHNAGAPTAEYPALLDAFELAESKAKAAMSEVLIEARRRREIFNMSLAQRDRFLEAGGYCIEAGRSGCKIMPRGTVAEGDAVEMLGNIPLKHVVSEIAK
jgi:hypothetical protein